MRYNKREILNLYDFGSETKFPYFQKIPGSKILKITNLIFKTCSLFIIFIYSEMGVRYWSRIPGLIGTRARKFCTGTREILCGVCVCVCVVVVDKGIRSWLQ